MIPLLLLLAQQDDYVPIRNWTQPPHNHWVIQDGVISLEPKDLDLWTEKEYADFVLKVGWRWSGEAVEKERPIILPDGTISSEKVKVLDAGDSGVYLRGTSKAQVNLWCWPAGSGEVHGYLTDPQMPPEVRTAAVPKKKADRPIGEWNSMVVTMKGDRLTVVLNGEEVIGDAHLPGVPPKGKIALQYHGEKVQFRNIFIKELQ
jgi:hypothetical protein